MTAFGRRVAQQVPAAPISSTAANQHIMLLLTAFAFGVVSFYLASYTWSGMLTIPTELKIPAGNIRLDADLPRRVRPWAPWWIMPTIVAPLGMVFWRIFAMRRGNISLRGGAVAAILVLCTAFVVALFCLEIGAMLQYDPQPPIWKIASLVPLIAIESIAFLGVEMFINGIVYMPAFALIGLGFAAASRILMRNADFLLG